MTFSSKYDARTWIQTCSVHAKNRPCHTDACSKIYFSCSVNLNTFWSTSIDAGDCFRRSCIEELVTIAFQYWLVTKSSTSWVMVVTQRLYLRARLTSQNTNFALSSYCMMFHASSTTSKRFLFELLTVFQIYLSTIYMATGRRDSSRSRTENTTSHSWRLILVASENIQANIQYTYFSSLSVIHLAQSIVSRTL